MKKVSKREKIILVASCLAVLYFAATFLFSGSRSSLVTPGWEDSIQGFAIEIAQNLSKHQLTKTEQTILTKAQHPWPAQPFLLTDALLKDPDASTAQGISEETPSSLRYTGCLELGKKRIAIINGKEYEAGERIEASPYSVAGISMEQVLLKDAENRTVAVPMEDVMTTGPAPTTEQDK